jgi:hypothetical protein
MQFAGEGRSARLLPLSTVAGRLLDQIGRTMQIAAAFRNCNDLQSSATRPDFIAQFRPGFGETIAARQPALAETQPALRETDPQSSRWNRNP